MSHQQFDGVEIPDGQTQDRQWRELTQLLERPDVQRICPEHIRRWHAMLCESGSPPDLVEVLGLKQQVEEAIEQSGILTDAFRADAPTADELPIYKSPVSLVTLADGTRFCFDGSRPHNIVIFGMPRMGKTFVVLYLILQLVFLGYHIIVVERRNDFRRLLPPLKRLGVSCLIVTASQVPFSLFQGDPYNGDLDRELIVAEANALNDLLGRARAARLMNHLVAQHRATHGPGIGIPLSDFVEALEAMKGSGRERDVKEGVIGDLRGVEAEVGDAWNYFYSDFLEKRLALPGVTVLEGEGMGQLANRLLATVVQTRIYVRRADRAILAREAHLIRVDDDATEYIDAEKERGGLSPVSSTTRFAHLGQARNMGQYVIAHAPSAASPKLRQQCEITVLARTHDDPAHLKKAYHLSSDQVRAVQRLAPGEMVVVAPAIWPAPVRGHVPQLDLGDPSTEEIRAQLDAYRDTVTTVHRSDVRLTGQTVERQPAATSEPERRRTEDPSFTVDPLLRQMLAALSLYPYLTATTLYRRVHVNNRDGAAALRRGKSAGLLSSTVLPTGRRGAGVTIHVITAKAQNLVQQWGLAPAPPQPHRGGEDHRVVVQAMEDLATSRGFRARREFEVGGTAFDLAVFKEGTVSRLVQVAMSDPGREAKALIRAWADPEVRQATLTLVGRDRRLLEKVLEAIGDAGCSEVAEVLDTRFAGAVIKSANDRL